MKRKSFLDWIKKQEISESKHVEHRPEISIKKSVKMSVSLNDIIELGPETTRKGARVTRLAKIVEIKRNHVEALDLSKNDGSRIIVPIDHLYEKQELTGVRLRPFEERDLTLMGAKNLWVKLTPRQYSKYKSKYKEPESTPVVPKEPQIDDDQVKFLRNWFASAKAEDEKQKKQDQQTLNIFGSSQEEKLDTGTSIISKPSPLARFIKRNNEQ
jgi:hypothetical protein